MISFGTAGIRGPVRETVTPEVVVALGRAVGVDVRSRSDTAVVVARDGRETGAGLAAGLSAGLVSAGVTVRRAGQLPTPAAAHASLGGHAVVITASHNPPADNGIKLFRDGVEYDRDAEGRVEARLDEAPPPSPWDEWGGMTDEDPLPGYRDSILGFVGVDDPVDGPRIVVDCGNGMASLATPDVLRAIGCSVVAINDNVDGHFPGRSSKPTATSITDLREMVADGPFDLGVAHDGDADRIVVVDDAGGIVHEDTVVAILAGHYVSTAEVDTPVVVTTPNASSRIDERVNAHGGRVHRVALGSLHEGIAAARSSGDGVVFAAEPWKHIHPGLGDWIDGVASAGVLARLVAEAGGIDRLREPITERPYRKENVRCPEGVKDPAVRAVRTALADRFPSADLGTDHGVRLDFGDGSWVLVRASGTEPYIRIYAEGERVDDIVEAVSMVVESAIDAEG